MLAYINGRFLPQDQASVSLTDRGWLYGDAVFETLRTYGGRFFRLGEHLRRLQESSRLVGLELPHADSEWRLILSDLLARAELDREVMARITVTRGCGGSGIFPAQPIDPTVVIQLRELPDYPPETFDQGWSLITATVRRNSPAAIDPRIKSANFLNNVLAKRQALQAGADDALMLNAEGRVAECTVSNFFIVAGGRLVTPSPDDGVLAGITRRLILDLAGRSGLPFAEETIDLGSVYEAEEAFISLTSAGIIPIARLDGREIGRERPGPITRSLRRAYEDYVENFAWEGDA